MNTAVAVSFVSIRNVQVWMIIFQLSTALQMAWNAWLENLGAVDVAGGGCANKHLTTSRYLRALSRYLHLTMSRYLHWLWWVDIHYLLGWPARAARCMHVYRVAPNCTPRCRGSSKISHQRSSQPHTWLVRHNSNMHAEAEAGDCKSLSHWNAKYSETGQIATWDPFQDTHHPCDLYPAAILSAECMLLHAAFQEIFGTVCSKFNILQWPQSISQCIIR